MLIFFGTTDSLKIGYQQYGHKANNLVINFEDDDKLILQAGKTLAQQGVADETEIACFVMEEYKQYKEHPVTKW